MQDFNSIRLGKRKSQWLLVPVDLRKEPFRNCSNSPLRQCSPTRSRHSLRDYLYDLLVYVLRMAVPMLLYRRLLWDALSWWLLRCKILCISLEKFLTWRPPLGRCILGLWLPTPGLQVFVYNKAVQEVSLESQIDRLSLRYSSQNPSHVQHPNAGQGQSWWLRSRRGETLVSWESRTIEDINLPLMLCKAPKKSGHTHFTFRSMWWLKVRTESRRGKDHEAPQPRFRNIHNYVDICSSTIHTLHFPSEFIAYRRWYIFESCSPVLSRLLVVSTYISSQHQPRPPAKLTQPAVSALEKQDDTASGGGGTSLTISECADILTDAHLGDSISINGSPGLLSPRPQRHSMKPTADPCDKEPASP